MEDFFKSGVPWPATVDSILPYLVFLVEAGKGTTVVPSVVASCNWLLKRLQLPVLASRHPVVQALQERAVEQRGLDLRALREAVELPMAFVRELGNRLTPPGRSWFGGTLCALMAACALMTIYT